MITENRRELENHRVKPWALFTTVVHCDLMINYN